MKINRKVTMLLLVFVLVPCCAWADVITIVHITDAHVDRAEVSSYYDSFVQQGVWGKVDLVINTGDFADGLQNYIGELERIPQELVTGNHEFLTSTPASIAPYGNRVVYIKGYTIILIGWDIQPSLEWMETQLEFAVGPVIVAIHCPLLYRCEEHRAAMAEKDFAEAQYRIRELLGKHADKVVLVLSGHAHQNYTAIEHGILHITTTSLNYGYRLIRIGDNYIASRFMWSGNDDFEAGYACWLIPHNPYLTPEQVVLGLLGDQNFIHRFWRTN